MNSLSDATQTVRDGFLARTHLLDDAAQDAAISLLTGLPDDLETIRILFSDPHGILRGKTITTDALPGAFATGIRVPSTLLLKDTAQRTVFPVWSGQDNSPMHGAGDVVLVPDPATFRILPWSPHSAMILCEVAQTDGSLVSFAPRAVLRQAMDALADRGLRAVMGLEVEFQVFEVVDPSLDHGDTTMPPRPPVTRALTQGYQYLSETRYGEVESLLDVLRRYAQDMGMPVRSVEIEMGPSQFEFTFAPADPMTVADMAVTFRTLVKEVCHREGLHASFMAKPALPNAAANGWHIHQSICDPEGNNLFIPEDGEDISSVASAWIAGLLEHAAASCIATTPTVNGYKRYKPYELAPNRIGWGTDNRGAMIRTLMGPDDPASRIENRVADSTANPYFALAFQILSGLDGLSQGLTAPAPLASPYTDSATQLPQTLSEAIDQFDASQFYRDALGDVFVDYLCHLKRAEWDRYITSVSEWEQAEYFAAF